MRRILALTFATAALGLTPKTASAQTLPNCPYGTGNVTVAGSTAAQHIIQSVGGFLATNGTTVVYQGGGSCAGLDLIYSSSAPTGTATVYNADGGTYSCTIQSGQVPTLAAADVFPITCQNATALPVSGTVPSGFLDVHGPWQAMLFVQPNGVTGVPGISAEQAYWVLGFPTNGGNVSPWNLTNENGDGTGSGTLPDAGFVFIRNYLSGTQEMISSYIYTQDPTYVKQWVGVNAGGSGNVVKYVASFQGNANQSAVLGIVALDAYGSAKTTLQDLPFRAYGQNLAWYPDSTQNANDRQNVRDGHYELSGPVHFVAATTDGTTATDADVQAFLNVINGTTNLGNTDIVAVEASVFTVPDCAMLVTRSGDGIGVTNYAPPQFCGCAFEHDVSATSSLVPYTCTACTCATGTNCSGSAGPCPAAQSICNYGFCEVQ
jgi:ABC-type phosphate transport system substrate-binding protein